MQTHALSPEFPYSRQSLGWVKCPRHNEQTESEPVVGYLAGVVAIAFVVFGWAYWPIAWILLAALLLADFILET